MHDDPKAVETPDAPKPRPVHELDGVVANLELTVISIVQGMALSFLVEGARAIFVDGNLAALPYVIAGLLIACSLWTRAVLHALTVIRWPLELEHNFLYFVAALFEAALFSQAGHPERWYPIGAVMVAVFWVMFFRERRMYRVRRVDSAGPAGAALLDLLEHEHELNTRYFMPALLLVWGVFTALVFGLPEVFLRGGWHVALGVLQVLGLVAYLGHVRRFYVGITGRIVAARREWETHADA